MRKYLFFIFTTINLLIYNDLQAQDRWSLERCIQYSLDNSLEVQQALFNLQTEKIRLQAAKMDFLPAVFASVGQDFSFGRAATATALILDNFSQSSTSLGVRLDIPIFQGFKNYYNLKSQQFGTQATEFDLEKSRENSALNIIASYLQVLLNKEIYDISLQQQQLSEAQVDRLQLLMENGKCSLSEIYNARAALTTDEATTAQNFNKYQWALLDLAQLLNIKNPELFDIELLSDKVIDT